MRPFIAIMIPKKEILESVFKRTVHNIMEQLHHYDLKTDLYLVWVHLFREARKEARVIQLALDYHLEKIFVQTMQEFLENTMENQRCQLLSSFLLEFSHRLSPFKMDQGWHEGSQLKRLRIYGYHF